MVAPHKRRLFIDQTHTTLSGFQTGVQRVVRNICEHAVNCKSEFQKVVPVHWSQGVFRAVGVGENPGQANGFKSKSSRKSPVLKIANWFRMIGKTVSDVDQEQPPESVEFQAGDVLLLPDAYWAFPEIWPTVKTLSESGVHTAVVIYDLIPHTHSEIYEEEGANGFRAYVRLAYQHADCLLAISETVRKQLHLHLPSIVGTNSINMPIRSFRLGADIKEHTGSVRAELSSIFESHEHQRPYIMIGTIEARKNHSFALDALEELWSKYPHRRLCIVGQPGWKGQAVIDRICSHPRYQKELFWIQNASDAEVLYCYRNAKGVIFPSLTEGFGLPIVEALWNNCTVYASDTPIHREAGKNLCNYFSLDNPKGLAVDLMSHEGNSNRNETYSADLIETWPIAVAQLLDVIHDCLPPSNQRDQAAA